MGPDPEIGSWLLDPVSGQVPIILLRGEGDKEGVVAGQAGKGRSFAHGPTTSNHIWLMDNWARCNWRQGGHKHGGRRSFILLLLPLQPPLPPRTLPVCVWLGASPNEQATHWERCQANSLASKVLGGSGGSMGGEEEMASSGKEG